MAKKKKHDPEKEAQIADDLLIREVDDELRAEKLQHWWQRFGSLLVGACVVVVLATVAYQLASSYRNSKAEERASILLEATELAEKGQKNTAIETLKPLAEKDGGAAFVARLKQANFADEKEAQKHYTALAETAKTFPAIENLAQLQTGQWEAIGEGEPFSPLALEQKALNLIAKGEKKEAQEILLTLMGRADVPSSQKRRLNELLQGASDS